MKDIKKLARIQLIVIVLFTIFKFIRPGVLNSGSPEFFKLFLLSFPNFCEGVIGVIVLTVIGIYLKGDLKMNNAIIYISAIIIAAVYVTMQEFNIHSFGGPNVYDPNDVVYSFIGILVGGLIIFRLKPVMTLETRPESA